MDEIIITKELKENAIERKKKNIDSFSSLLRDNLAFQKTERILHLYTSKFNEKVFIQYPGKESVREKNPRPWDFRPKLLKPNGTLMEDLSFKMIWDDIIKLSNICDEATLRKLAAVFYRMSVMVDHTHTVEEYYYNDYEFASMKYVNMDIEYMEWYKYVPDGIDYILELEKVIPVIHGVSFGAYLVYNDLLAQNEDCKYYYRAIYEKNEKWKPSVGRHNNLWTHMSVIQFILGEISFTKIVDRFMRGMGVGPIGSEAEIAQVTSNLVHK